MGKGRALRSRTEAVREKTGRQGQAAGAPGVAPLLGPQVLAILLAQAQAPPPGQGQGSPSLSVWGRARTPGTYLLGQTARKQAGPGVEGKAEGWGAPKNRSDRNRGSGKGCTGARATAREQAEGRGREEENQLHPHGEEPKLPLAHHAPGLASTFPRGAPPRMVLENNIP